MENQKNNNQLQIELKDEVAQGTYANLAIITHSSSEFIVDFVRVMPGLPKAGVQSRIVLTPEHAKRQMFALQENVICGHLIPAGTGQREFDKIIVGSKEEYDRMLANRRNVLDYSEVE